MRHYDICLLHNFALTLVTGQVVMARFKASSVARQGEALHWYGGYAGTTQQTVVPGAFKHYIRHNICFMYVLAVYLHPSIIILNNSMSSNTMIGLVCH